MKIIVCVKQVPGSTEVRLDPETHAMVRDAVAAGINPQDLCALEAALQLKKKNGARVDTLSMGIPATENLLRDTLARGADGAMLLTDRAFAGADTLATAYTLSLGVRALGGADLLCCGKNAIDGDTAQIGPELAAMSGFRLVTDVAEIVGADETAVTVRKLTDTGTCTVKVRLPAVLTVLGTEILPALPSLAGVRDSLTAKVAVLDAAGVGADVTRTGFAGSPTSVVRTFAAENSRKAEPLPAGTDIAAYLLDTVGRKEDL